MGPIVSHTGGFRSDVDNGYTEGEPTKNLHQKIGVSLIKIRVMSVSWVCMVAFCLKMNYSAEHCCEC